MRNGLKSNMSFEFIVIGEQRTSVLWCERIY